MFTCCGFQLARPLAGAALCLDGQKLVIIEHPLAYLASPKVKKHDMAPWEQPPPRIGVQVPSYPTEMLNLENEASYRLLGSVRFVANHIHSRVRCGLVRGSLTGRKKSVPERQFCRKTVCSSSVQPWLVAIGGWQLVAVGGGWRRLAVGRRWRLAVGGWWLVIPWGGPSGRSLMKKKSSSLRTPLGLVEKMISGFPELNG